MPPGMRRLSNKKSQEVPAGARCGRHRHQVSSREGPVLGEGTLRRKPSGEKQAAAALLADLETLLAPPRGREGESWLNSEQPGEKSLASGQLASRRHLRQQMVRFTSSRVSILATLQHRFSEKVSTIPRAKGDIKTRTASKPLAQSKICCAQKMTTSGKRHTIPGTASLILTPARLRVKHQLTSSSKRQEAATRSDHRRGRQDRSVRKRHRRQRSPTSTPPPAPTATTTPRPLGQAPRVDARAQRRAKGAGDGPDGGVREQVRPAPAHPPGGAGRAAAAGKRKAPRSGGAAARCSCPPESTADGSVAGSLAEAEEETPCPDSAQRLLNLYNPRNNNEAAACGETGAVVPGRTEGAMDGGN